MPLPLTPTAFAFSLLLPQSVEEIRQLKSALAKEERRTRDLIVQLNKQAAKVEDLYDENAMLRQRAGLGEGDKVDIKDIKMQKEATIAQLRALNALLERQVRSWRGRGAKGPWRRGMWLGWSCV